MNGAVGCTGESWRPKTLLLGKQDMSARHEYTQKEGSKQHGAWAEAKSQASQTGKEAEPTDKQEFPA